MPTWRHCQFFVTLFFSLVNFSYWAKFHVNIITGSGIITIYFYKELTRNPEIRNTPVWLLSNIWRLGRVWNTKFGMDLSLIKFYLMLQNARVTAFIVSELLREKQQGGLKLPPPRLWLRKYLKTDRMWLCQAIGKLFFRTLRRGMKVKNCFQNTFTSRNGRIMTIITNHTSACLFSCKFVAYFLNTFSKELFWTAASGHLNSF